VLGLRVPEADGLDVLLGDALAAADREALGLGVRAPDAELLLSLPQAVITTSAATTRAPKKEMVDTCLMADMIGSLADSLFARCAFESHRFTQST